MSEPQVFNIDGELYGVLEEGNVKGVGDPVPPTVNPYAGVDWATVGRYVGMTHMHPEFPRQQAMDEFYSTGIRAMAWSGYFPEQPIDPSAFTSIPSDVIMVKNSEQHSCTDSLLHFCPLGSTYSNNGGTLVPWRDAFDAALDLLEDPDGGGLTLNHLSWSSSVPNATWLAMLDHDPRVLGIEVRNHGTVMGYPAPKNGTDYGRWDTFLATGRRVWGFWAHDHYVPEYAPYLGFNMLLLTDPTAQDALRAYRRGRFYGSLTQQLRLTDVTPLGRYVQVSTDAADELRMITDLGVQTVTGRSALFKVPDAAVYARFEGENDDDTVYTQPILY